MPVPSWFPQYNPKKLIYHLPLFLIFLFFLLHSTVDTNNFYNRAVDATTKFISNAVGSYLSSTNFLKNSSFESNPSNTETFPAWNSFGMKLDTSIENNNSASTLDLVTISQHSLSQVINFPFPPNSQFLLSFDLKQDDTSIKPVVNVIFYHFDNTNSSFSWTIEDAPLDTWKNYTHDFIVAKPCYKIVLTVNVDSAKSSPTFFDNFQLRWRSSQ